MEIDWNSIMAWIVVQTTTWITIFCALIMIFCALKIGEGRRKQRKQER